MSCFAAHDRRFVTKIQKKKTSGTSLLHRKIQWSEFSNLASATWMLDDSVKSVRHERPSGRFSKWQCLAASVSFRPLSHPLLIFALTPFFARAKRLKSRSSLFAPRKRLLRRLIMLRRYLSKALTINQSLLVYKCLFVLNLRKNHQTVQNDYDQGITFKIMDSESSSTHKGTTRATATGISLHKRSNGQ